MKTQKKKSESLLEPKEKFPEAEAPKSSRKRVLVVGVILGFLIAIFIGGFFLFRSNKLALLPGVSSFEKLVGKNLKELVDPVKSVSKEIGEEGGSITVKTSQGKWVTLTIPAKSLEKGASISLTPINESPIENYDPNEPGVVIGPPGIKFDPPAIITIGNNPPPAVNNNPPGNNPPGANNPPGNNPPGNNPPGNNPPGNNPPGNNPPGNGDDNNDDDQGGTDDNGGTGTIPTPEQFGVQDLGNALAGLQQVMDAYGTTGTGGTSPTLTTEPLQGAIQTAAPSNSNSQPGRTATSGGSSSNSVVVHVGYGGTVSVVTYGSTNADGSVSGPIDETGAVSTDEPSEDESGALTDNEANNAGGQCSTEFLQTVAGYIRNGASAEDVAGYRRLIEDCLDVDYLRDLCAHDKMKLRRREFQWRIELAATIDPVVAREIENLKNSCGARYKTEANGSYTHAGGSVTTANWNSTVCGYLDDEWSGTYSWQTQMPGVTPSYQSFSGTSQFNNMPAIGAFVVNVLSDGYFTLSGNGSVVNLPNFGWAFWVDFDGNSSLVSSLFGEFIVANSRIVMIEPSCDSQEPPLEPLPGNSGPGSNPPDEDEPLPPLEPLPGSPGNSGNQKNQPNDSNHGYNPYDDYEPPLEPLSR